MCRGGGSSNRAAAANGHTDGAPDRDAHPAAHGGPTDGNCDTLAAADANGRPRPNTDAGTPTHAAADRNAASSHSDPERQPGRLMQRERRWAVRSGEPGVVGDAFTGAGAAAQAVTGAGAAAPAAGAC